MPLNRVVLEGPNSKGFYSYRDAMRVCLQAAADAERAMPDAHEKTPGRSWPPGVRPTAARVVPRVAPGLVGADSSAEDPCLRHHDAALSDTPARWIQPCLASKNCSSSVEPFNAPVEACASIVVVTASK